MAATAGFEQRYQAAADAGDQAGAAACLEDGAAAGDPFCCGQLGVWRLLGRHGPRDDAAGFRLVKAAARAGLPEAVGLMATLHARGRGTPASWPKAVDWLIRGARGGDPACLRQLGFLMPPGRTSDQRTLLALAAQGGDAAAGRRLARGGVSAAAPGHPDWAAIKRAARRPVLPGTETEIVRRSPSITFRRGVLDADLRDYLICAAMPHLSRAGVNDPSGGDQMIADSRTNMFANFWLLEGDVVTDCVDRMIARIVGIPPEMGEPMSILRYAPGEQFAPHYDFFDPGAPGHAAHIAQGGQRVMTCLVYLNDAYTGGETAFLELDLSLRGAPGDALTWRNVTEEGAPDRQTRHAGLPPKSGEKWLLSKWFRNKDQGGVAAPAG